MLSRVADSLYWMSRYLERAEHTTRLLDVNLNLMLDESAASAERRWQRVLPCRREWSPTKPESSCAPRWRISAWRGTSAR